MANVNRALPAIAFPKPVVKLYLYKVSREHPLWNFNHDFRKLGVGAGAKVKGGLLDYVATGGDPSDLDLPSNKVSEILSAANLARLPFDSWIPRSLNTPISPITGTPFEATIPMEPSAKAYYKLEDMDRNNIKLNWKNLYGDKFIDNFKTFFAAHKAYLIDQLADLINVFKEQPEEALDRYDLTTFLIRYGHTTVVDELNNTLELDLASDPSALYSAGTEVRLAAATDLGNSTSSATKAGVVGDVSNSKIPLLEENDIIELRVKYLDDDNDKWEIQESGFVDAEGFRRVYMGYVSSMSRSTGYNNQERLSVAVAGASKIFSLYDVSFTPSLAQNSIFEQGVEMSDTRFTIWGNNLMGKSADVVFDNFMRSGLFCAKLEETVGGGAGIAKRIQAAEEELAKIERLKDSSDPVYHPVTKEGEYKLYDKKTALNKVVAQGNARLDQLKEDNLTKVFNLTNLPGSESSAAQPPSGVKNLDIEYYLPISMQDSVSTSFQLINYIPVLMGLARQYAVRDMLPPAEVADTGEYLKFSTRVKLLSRVLATAEQAGYPPYKAMMATAFKGYYPELKRPAAIFSDIKANTFLEIFEDRPGVIRIRPPKYNILNLNPDVKDYDKTDAPIVAVPYPQVTGTFYAKLNAEHVIPASAIMALTLKRDDVSIVTRADHTYTAPFGGQYLDGITGHFTDAGYLMKYGLRTTGPLQSPMSLSPQIAAALSAVRLATTNATARSITLSVFNTREYQVGRLYYIPTSIPDQSEVETSGIVSKGIVGYVVSITTSLNHAQEATHNLTLNYVRQADILRIKLKGSQAPYAYYANFKRLPDISTYMRLLATDTAFAADATKSVTNIGNKKVEASSNSTSATSGNFMVIPNGTVKDAVVTSSYAATLIGAGVKNIDTDDKAIEPERNNFVTTIEAAALADAADVSISKNLLAKFVTYDMDPRLKIYPTFKATNVEYTGAALTPGNLIPLTESTNNRTTDDLMRVIYGMLVGALNYSNLQTQAFSVSDDFWKTVKISYSGTVKYIKVSDSLSGSDASSIKYNIVIATDSADKDTYPGHVLFAFVNTKHSTDAYDTNKFFVFHVPYGVPGYEESKSLRLANLINKGTPQGCGYRKLSTNQAVSGYTGTAGPKGDVHTTGDAVLLSTLDVSLWSFKDIITACVELDLVYGIDNASEIPQYGSPVTEENSDAYHLIRSYINCVVEPYNYIHQLNPCYNDSALYSMSLKFNKETAAKIMQGCFAKCAALVDGADYATAYVTEVPRSTDEEKRWYFKDYFSQYLATLSELVIVPVNGSYFSIGTPSGVGIFDRLSSEKQTLFTSNRALMYVSVMRQMQVADVPASTSGTAPTQWSVSPGTGSGKYLLAPGQFDTDTTYLDAFSFYIPKSLTAASASGYTIEQFLTNKLLCIHLVDNIPLTKFYEPEARITELNNHALSNVWHSAYYPMKEKGRTAFQTPRVTDPLDPAVPRVRYQKLNLKELMQ